MPEIVVAPAEASYRCPDDDTILRAALRAGLGFPYECNVGACGNCRFELLAGEVAHAREAPPAWSERDRQRNRFLGCQARPLSDCRVKVSLRARYESLYRPKRTQARLVSAEDVTHDIREFSFALAEPNLFRPGQYALLDLPGVAGARPYSMCSVPAEGARWDFQIKKVPNGAATTYLFDALRIGDAVCLDGPYGMAYLREDAPRDILCVAGGSGLSPMISITRAAARSRELAERSIHFIYGGRGARDICGEPMLRTLPGFGSRIRYYPSISVPEGDSDQAWRGQVGFVHEVTHEMFRTRLPEFEIYFAGPPAMGQAMEKMLYELKVPQEQTHFDQFY